MPFSMNKYVYCFNSGIVFVDLDGAWPSLADIRNSVTKTVKDGAKWLDEYKEDIGKVAIIVAGVVAVGVVVNPTGAFLGGACQLATDLFL